MLKFTNVEKNYIVQLEQSGQEELKNMSPAMSDIQKLQMLIIKSNLGSVLTFETTENVTVLTAWVNIAWKKKNFFHGIMTSKFSDATDLLTALSEGLPVTFSRNEKLDEPISRETQMLLHIDHMGIHCPTPISKFAIETSNRYQFLVSLNEKLLGATNMLTKQSPYKIDSQRGESISKISDEVGVELDTCLLKMEFLKTISGGDFYSETPVSVAYSNFRGGSVSNETEVEVKSEGLND